MAERLRLAVRGAVQGVGFRPFVYRLAHDRQLRGWCRNSPHGVLIEVEGERPVLDDFRVALEREPPLRSLYRGLVDTRNHSQTRRRQRAAFRQPPRTRAGSVSRTRCEARRVSPGETIPS